MVVVFFVFIIVVYRIYFIIVVIKVFMFIVIEVDFCCSIVGKIFFFIEIIVVYIRMGGNILEFFYSIVWIVNVVIGNVIV